MQQLNEEMLNKPAEEEYSFSFGGGIFGDYAPEQNEHMYLLLATKVEPDELLVNLEMPENRLKEFVFTVKIGETLEMAVKRILKEELGLEELFKYEYRLSESNPVLVNIRVICKNTALNGRKFKEMNLYWYGASSDKVKNETPKVKKITGEIVNSPADSEYFTRFLGIYSINEQNEPISIKLHQKESDLENKEVILYCDKVKVGETLEDSIKRSMMSDFGLELLSYRACSWVIDEAKNKLGQSLPRIGVMAYVKYGPIEDKKAAGCFVSWVKRESELLKFKLDPEALGWIKNDSTNSLAINRFTNKEEARVFIEKLYMLGALEVRVKNIKQKIEVEKFGDILVVVLPENVEVRQKIFSLYYEEMTRKVPGKGWIADDGERELVFRWD